MQLIFYTQNVTEDEIFQGKQIDNWMTDWTQNQS